MLTDKIYSASPDFELLDDLRGDKVLWSGGLRPITLSVVKLTNKRSKLNLEPPKDLAAQNGKVAVNIIDMGKLLLQYAKEGDVAKVLELMARGAPFTSDWLGMSALHFAAMHNKYEVCQVLLRGGVNKDAKTKVDRTPLHIAACEGHEDIVKLLLSKKADVNPVDMLRMTPLHWAVEKGYTNIVRLLLKHGANVTAVSKFNKTPISIARQTKQTDILAELEIEKERHDREGPKISVENTQNETETKQAVNSIADSCNYDVIANLNEEISPADKISQEASKSRMGSPMKEEIDPPTNRSDTCQSSDDLIDEDMDYVEPIIQLESIDDDQKQLDNSTLELLKCHGISMLPVDDHENNLISSALQSGRKLVLSEAGKRILNDTKFRQTSEKLVSPKKSENFRPISGYKLPDDRFPSGTKKPAILMRAKVPLKPNKNIKIISIDTFKKMYGPEMISNLRKAPPLQFEEKSPPTITKITKVQNSQNVPSTKNQPTARIINVQKVAQKETSDEELPPNIIVCSDSEAEEANAVANSGSTFPPRIPNATSSKPAANAEGLGIAPKLATVIKAKPKNNSPYCVTAPVMSFPEITRQIILLKRQVAELQKENAEYKTRIEKLEKDREGESPRES